MDTDTHDSAAVKYDESKLKELMLYISDRLGGSPTFGATMLNKILFFSDFFHYAEHGRSITGAEYQRLDHGPAPKELIHARTALHREKRAVVRVSTLGPYQQQRLEALVKPKIEMFSATEIKQVDDVIAMIGVLTGKQASDYSHNTVGWRLAKTGETIPYETVFVFKTAVSDDDYKVAADLKKKLVAA